MTLAFLLLHWYDSFRGNPVYRPSSGSVQFDDCFTAMSSRFCTSALGRLRLGATSGIRLRPALENDNFTSVQDLFILAYANCFSARRNRVGY